MSGNKLELHQVPKDMVKQPSTALLRFASIIRAYSTIVFVWCNYLWNQNTGFGVCIEPGCNGVEAFIVLCAALFAFSANWQHKVWGLAVGFVAIQLLNVLRVISLFYLGQWNKEVFDFAHNYLWQGLIMLDVLVVWLLWIRVASPNPTPPTTQSSPQAV